MTSILNNIYMGVKGFFGVGVGLSSIVIFTNSISYPINIIVGAFDIVIAILILTDFGITSKVIKQLDRQIDRLNQENLTYAQNNAQLTYSLDTMRNRVQELQHLNEEYSHNNERLNQEIDEFESNIKQQNIQIYNLRLIQNQSKQLIAALMTAVDDFKDFNSTLLDSIDMI